MYRTKEGTTATDFALKKCLGRKVPGLDHSTLARKLDLRCFAADWDERGLRTFHRPKLRKEHTPAGASKRMSEVVSTHEQRELKRPKPGRWKAQDLSTVDGTGRDDIVLAEYCEQFPLLVHNSGMCMLVRNYYKQKDASDAIPKVGGLACKRSWRWYSSCPCVCVEGGGGGLHEGLCCRIGAVGTHAKKARTSMGSILSQLDTRVCTCT